jgi:hypothetical protein
VANSSDGTTRSTSPILRASAADIDSPVSSKCKA